MCVSVYGFICASIFTDIKYAFIFEYQDSSLSYCVCIYVFIYVYIYIYNAIVHTCLYK